MKTILLLVHFDRGQEARVRAALDLTRVVSGHLKCVDVTPFFKIIKPGRLMAPVGIVDEAPQERLNREELRKRFQAEGISWSWTDARGDYAELLLAQAQTADVIVLNRRLHGDSEPDMVRLAGKLLAGTEAILLAVDETCAGLELDMPALLAWDGSRPAWHALKQAVPLLQHASAVNLVQVGLLPPTAILAGEAAQYLARHGIAVAVDMALDEHDPVAAICHAVERHQAAWCVMGAYGHSRLSETLFGGVTRSMLMGSGVPLFLAH